LESGKEKNAIVEIQLTIPCSSINMAGEHFKVLADINFV
jgi:hypothetical protein